MIMTKPVFHDEFKQGVVDDVLQHPVESQLSIAKKFGIADSMIHKWLKDTQDALEVLKKAIGIVGK